MCADLSTNLTLASYFCVLAAMIRSTHFFMNSPKSSFFLDLEIPVKNGSLCVRVGAFAWMLMTLEAWLVLPSAVINTVPGLAFFRVKSISMCMSTYLVFYDYGYLFYCRRWLCRSSNFLVEKNWPEYSPNSAKHALSHYRLAISRIVGILFLVTLIARAMNP